MEGRKAVSNVEQVSWRVGNIDVGGNGGWRNRERVVKFGKIFFGLQFQIFFNLMF